MSVRHMRATGLFVGPEPFLRLFEVATDDVGERKNESQRDVSVLTVAFSFVLWNQAQVFIR
jgi:hypothetical protein